MPDFKRHDTIDCWYNYRLPEIAWCGCLPVPVSLLACQLSAPLEAIPSEDALVLEQGVCLLWCMMYPRALRCPLALQRRGAGRV